MNDYIDIGVLGADSVGAGGRSEKRFLYLHKYKLTRGEHEITVVVEGEPKVVGIDPLGLLMDRNGNNNWKEVE
jgi:ABC-2 type transport system permease protein